MEGADQTWFCTHKYGLANHANTTVHVLFHGANLTRPRWESMECFSRGIRLNSRREPPQALHHLRHLSMPGLQEGSYILLKLRFLL